MGRAMFRRVDTSGNKRLKARPRQMEKIAMTSLLPGLMTRYALAFIGAQLAVFLLMLTLDAFGWGGGLSSTVGNVAVLIAAGAAAGRYVAGKMGMRPGWRLSVTLSALLATLAVLAGSLILAAIAVFNGVGGAELQLLAGQMGMTPVTAAVVLFGLSLALSFPVTVAGFRIGAGAMATRIENSRR